MRTTADLKKRHEELKLRMAQKVAAAVERPSESRAVKIINSRLSFIGRHNIVEFEDLASGARGHAVIGNELWAHNRLLQKNHQYRLEMIRLEKPFLNDVEPINFKITRPAVHIGESSAPPAMSDPPTVFTYKILEKSLSGRAIVIRARLLETGTERKILFSMAAAEKLQLDHAYRFNTEAMQGRAQPLFYVPDMKTGEVEIAIPKRRRGKQKTAQWIATSEPEELVL